MRSFRKRAALVAALAALVLSWSSHQGLTKDTPKTIVVLSTSDVLGYLTPCG